MTKFHNCFVNCIEHSYFCDLDLFRISDFVLRISIFVYPWRPLGLREKPSLSDSLNPNSTEYFKYVWLLF